MTSWVLTVFPFTMLGRPTNLPTPNFCERFSFWALPKKIQHETGAQVLGGNLVLQDFGDSDKNSTNHNGFWVFISYVHDRFIHTKILFSPFPCSTQFVRLHFRLQFFRPTTSCGKKEKTALETESSFRCWGLVLLGRALCSGRLGTRRHFEGLCSRGVDGGERTGDKKRLGWNLKKKSLEVLRMSSMISWRWFQMISKEHFCMFLGWNAARKS